MSKPKHVAALRARRLAAGLCVECGQERDGPSKRYCVACSAKARERMRRRNGYRLAVCQPTFTSEYTLVVVDPSFLEAHGL